MSRGARLLGAVAMLVSGTVATSACNQETAPLDGGALILDRSNSGLTDKFDMDKSSASIAQQVLARMEPGDGLWVMGFSTNPTEQACRPLVYMLPKMGQSSDVDQVRSSNEARLEGELPSYMECLSSETYGSGNENGTELFSAIVAAAGAADVALGSRVLRLRYVGDACSTEPMRVCSPDVLSDPEAAARVIDALDPALKPRLLLEGRELVITTTPRKNPLSVVEQERLHEIYTTYASTVGMTVVFE